jgi:hypothetical protein
MLPPLRAAVEAGIVSGAVALVADATRVLSVAACGLADVASGAEMEHGTISPGR